MCGDIGRYRFAFIQCPIAGWVRLAPPAAPQGGPATSGMAVCRARGGASRVPDNVMETR
jgi:hypothetical protein